MRRRRRRRRRRAHRATSARRRLMRERASLEWVISADYPGGPVAGLIACAKAELAMQWDRLLYGVSYGHVNADGILERIDPAEVRLGADGFWYWVSPDGDVQIWARP